MINTPTIDTKNLLERQSTKSSKDIMSPGTPYIFNGIEKTATLKRISSSTGSDFAKGSVVYSHEGKVNYETVTLPVRNPDDESTSDGEKELATNMLSRHFRDSRMLQAIKAQVAAKGQRVRVMAGVTMYNEAEDELQFTMEGIVRNHK